MLRTLALAVLAVGGCATSRPEGGPTGSAPSVPPSSTEAPPSDPAGPVRLALGATAQVAGTAVRFAAVEEDSRCPRGTTCVWEGRARVRLDVAGAPVVLTVPHGGPPREDEPSTARQGGVLVEVMGLHPYPGSPEAEAGATAEVELVVRPLAP
ncbi:MAG TPA: hypothetical protein VF576_03895 [Rubricoccaceae bacterium]